MTDINQYLTYLYSLEGISESNKEAVRWFLDECAAEGLSDVRQCKYLFGFKTLLTRFMPYEVNLAEASEQELKRVVAAIHRSEYVDTTQCFLKQCLKKFGKYQNGGRFPAKMDFINTTEKKQSSVRKEDLFSQAELYQALSQLRNIRDRAYIVTQYESAGRTGEVLNAKLGDVRLDERGDFIRLYGLKNMPDREIQLVDAGYYLKEWLRMHPSGGDPFSVQDPEAPLWVKLEQFGCQRCDKSLIKHFQHEGCGQYMAKTLEPMTLANIQRNFQRACQRAGVQKRTYRLYNLRHSRITEASQFMSHEQLCKFAGWKPGSGQFNVYVHLTSEDVNQAIRDQYNLGRSEKPEPVTCKICWQQNPPGSSECRNCRRPVTIKAAAQGSEANDVQEAVQVLAELKEQGKLDQLMAVASQLQTTE